MEETRPPAEKKPAPSPGRTRRRKVLLVLALFLFFSATGLLQQLLFPRIAGLFLGASISTQVKSTMGTLRLSELRVADPASAPDASPLLTVDRVEMPWRVFRQEGRHIPELRVEGVNLTLDTVAGNDRFLRDFLAQPASGIDLNPYLPGQTTLAPLRLSLLTPDASIWMKGLRLDAQVDRLDWMHATLASTGLTGGWGLGYRQFDNSFSGGTLSLMLSREGGEWFVDGKLQLPQDEGAEGSLHALTSKTGMTVAGGIKRLHLVQPVWGELAAAMSPVPVRFGPVSATDIAFKGAQTNGRWALSQLQAELQVDDLSLGPEATPWFRGDVSLHGGKPAAEAPATLSVQAGPLPPLQLVVEDKAGERRGTMRADRWQRKELLALSPAAQPLAPWLATLDTLSLEMEGQVSSQNYVLKSTLTPTLATAAAVSLSVEASGPLAVHGHQIHAVLKAEDGAVQVEARQEESGSFAADILFSQVSPGRWWRALTGQTLLDPLAATLEGTVKAAYGADGVVSMLADLQTPSLGWSNRTLAETPLTVQGKVNRKNDILSLEGVLALGEDTALALKQGVYHTATGEASAHLSGPVSLAPWAKLAGFADLWGQFRVDMPLKRSAQGVLRAAPLQLAVESLGWGGLSLPYGEMLTITAPCTLTPTPLAAETGPVEAVLGADTKMRTDGVTLKDGGISAVNLTLETGLAPLVSKGWLSAAEGLAHLRCSSIQWGASPLKATVEYEGAFSRLIVAGEWCKIAGLSAHGPLTITESGLSGTGSLHVATVTVSGAQLSGLAADVRGDGFDLVLENVALSLFGGAVAGTVRTPLRDPLFPVRIEAKVTNLDLAVFTQEFKPPSVVLTGRVNGAVSAVMALDGLRDLSVDLKATDGFSVNKDLVEQWLTNQYVGGITGGSQMAGMVRDVLGEDAQRMFDEGDLKLGLVNGRIAGEARLASKQLNLTVDIKADPAAVWEAITSSREEAGLVVDSGAASAEDNAAHGAAQ